MCSFLDKIHRGLLSAEKIYAQFIKIEIDLYFFKFYPLVFDG